jgi:RNA methyltransferase, TrmH family
MLSHSQQKFLTSLQVKKYRQKYRNFLVEGVKIAGELLTQHWVPVVAVYATDEWIQSNVTLAEAYNAQLTGVTEAELRKISALTTPNQVLVVAECPQSPLSAPAWESEGAFSLYLEGIQDPGNMGAMLRIADWFGFGCIYCSPDCVDVYSPKVIQAGMGACLRIFVEEAILADVKQRYPQVPLIGAVMDGDNLFTAPLPVSGLLVIGNEGRGIRQDTLPLLDHRVTIPRGAGGQAESLNAAVAAGILSAMLCRNYLLK